MQQLCLNDDVFEEFKQIVSCMLMILSASTCNGKKTNNLIYSLKLFDDIGLLNYKENIIPIDYVMINPSCFTRIRTNDFKVYLANLMA